MKDKEKIEQKLNRKVLCMFLGGSNAYGLQSSNSDRDIMVIVNDNEGLRHIPFRHSEDGLSEFFIMGKDYFKKVHEYDDEANDFIVAHADNILGIKLEGNLLFLDDEYKEEFERIVNEDWILKLPKFLHRFVSFYRLTIGHGANYKKHYHVYRLRAMLDNLDSTGSFNLSYAEPYKETMLFFKEHHKMLPDKNKEVAELLDYIEDYANRLE